MIKKQASIRREEMEKARGGVGITVFNHLLEKTEMRANCRMFTRITLEPGNSIGVHKHEEEEDVYYILKGVATVNDNGETVTLHPGDVAFAQSGDSHGIANDGQETLEFVSVIMTYQPPER
ncbi:MAG: cupin domain-containing protein [Treponema sp.]|nr:cupin domain-containing protein [Treponema sp.]